ncbi:hypothetical protein FWG95_03545, partial [Candidatus Saccharibacteria bacterium]|nr:hypothetical protein [Candidatus Saccharibacteria bacterium]
MATSSKLAPEKKYRAVVTGVDEDTLDNLAKIEAAKKIDTDRRRRTLGYIPIIGYFATKYFDKKIERQERQQLNAGKFRGEDIGSAALERFAHSDTAFAHGDMGGIDEGERLDNPEAVKEVSKLLEDEVKDLLEQVKGNVNLLDDKDLQKTVVDRVNERLESATVTIDGKSYMLSKIVGLFGRNNIGEVVIEMTRSLAPTANNRQEAGLGKKGAIILPPSPTPEQIIIAFNADPTNHYGVTQAQYNRAMRKMVKDDVDIGAYTDKRVGSEQLMFDDKESSRTYLRNILTRRLSVAGGSVALASLGVGMFTPLAPVIIAGAAAGAVFGVFQGRRAARRRYDRRRSLGQFEKTYGEAVGDEYKGSHLYDTKSATDIIGDLDGLGNKANKTKSSLWLEKTAEAYARAYYQGGITLSGKLEDRAKFMARIFSAKQALWDKIKNNEDNFATKFLLSGTEDEKRAAFEERFKKEFGRQVDILRQQRDGTDKTSRQERGRQMLRAGLIGGAAGGAIGAIAPIGGHFLGDAVMGRSSHSHFSWTQAPWSNNDGHSAVTEQMAGENGTGTQTWDIPPNTQFPVNGGNIVIDNEGDGLVDLVMPDGEFHNDIPVDSAIGIINNYAKEHDVDLSGLANRLGIGTESFSVTSTSSNFVLDSYNTNVRAGGGLGENLGGSGIGNNWDDWNRLLDNPEARSYLLNYTNGVDANGNPIRYFYQMDNGGIGIMRPGDNQVPADVLDRLADYARNENISVAGHETTTPGGSHTIQLLENAPAPTTTTGELPVTQYDLAGFAPGSQQTALADSYGISIPGHD